MDDFQIMLITVSVAIVGLALGIVLPLGMVGLWLWFKRKYKIRTLIDVLDDSLNGRKSFRSDRTDSE